MQQTAAAACRAPAKKAACTTANGNLTNDGAGQAYAYDAENRLVSASGVKNAVLSYDPLGRLWQVAGTATTQFLYDGDELVSEYNGATLLRRYVHGPGVDEPVIADEGSAFDCTGTRVLHTDRQGSIVATADCWGGRQAINTYDEYGVPAAGNASVSAGGRFGYTGQIWIPELGLWHYKARFYSAKEGRFLQVDPVGYEGGINLYRYATNDPLNRSDSQGLVDIYIGGGGDDWFTRNVATYAANVGGKYFSWTDHNRIVGFMRAAAARGEQINLIGHSLGASKAIVVASETGVRIDNLITQSIQSGR